MSLTQALSAALSGLRTTQSSLALVSTNVSNSETPGYVRRTPVLETTTTGGVQFAAVSRELDVFVQRALRTELAGGGYAAVRASYYERLDQVFGEPGSDSALETVYNNFMEALQELSGSSESYSARSLVLTHAQSLAQALNTMSSQIQGLRTDAEQSIAAAVDSANMAMEKIAAINVKLAGLAGTENGLTASLLDERDQYIDQLAQMMGVQVVPGANNQVSVFTTTGVQLVGNTASKLSFDAKGTLSASSTWSADPNARTIGTITLTTATGASSDLVAAGSFKTGEIGALLEMRDKVLVETQRQLDEIASVMALAFSNFSEQGTAVTSGAAAGFEVDTAGLMPGNTIQVAYRDHNTGAVRTVTIMRVDDQAALPLSNDVTADPNDRVIGVDFSQGMASVVEQINAALGSNMQAVNPGGTMLQFLDDGAPNLVDVTGVTVTKTATSLTGGTAELPFFVDGASVYSGAITASGPQVTGFAGRIAINPSLLEDPSRLVIYSTSPLTPDGDSTRPDFLYERLNSATFSFSSAGGIGSTAAPFQGTITSFLRQTISQVGANAEAAARLNEGQSIVVTSLLERYAETSTVNLDEEMSRLMTLQTAYGANARVMTTVQELFDILMRM
jgi:flagellar hook-associated protein 1 FlgK